MIVDPNCRYFILERHPRSSPRILFGRTMKRRFVIAAICIAAALFGGESVSAQEDVEAATIINNAIEHLEDIAVDDSAPLEDENKPSTSVPEPTTFGLIAMGLAVGGGLMVRRKTD